MSRNMIHPQSVRTILQSVRTITITWGIIILSFIGLSFWIVNSLERRGRRLEDLNQNLQIQIDNLSKEANVIKAQIENRTVWIFKDLLLTAVADKELAWPKRLNEKDTDFIKMYRFTDSRRTGFDLTFDELGLARQLVKDVKILPIMGRYGDIKFKGIDQKSRVIKMEYFCEENSAGREQMYRLEISIKPD